MKNSKSIFINHVMLSMYIRKMYRYVGMPDQPRLYVGEEVSMSKNKKKDNKDKDKDNKDKKVIIFDLD